MDYESAGNFYDEARVADGIGMMCKMLTALTEKPMNEVSGLDYHEVGL